MGLTDIQPDGQFDQVARLAASRFDTEIGLIVFFDHDADQMYCKNQTGLDEHWGRQENLRLSGSICRHVPNQNGPVQITDTDSHPLTRGVEHQDNLGCRSFLGVPIRGTSTTVIGAICLAGRSPRTWEPQEIIDLEALAHCISSLVSHRMAIWQLRQQLQRTEAESQTRVDMLADVSHELRTPLNGLLGMASALEQTDLTPAQREMLELMEQAGNLLRRLADDLLDIAQMEEGALSMPEAPFRPSQTVQGLIALAQATKNDAAPPIRFEDKIGAATVLIGSEARIQQVLANLLENALTSDPAGPVRIRAALSGESGGGDAVLNLSVVDSGPGIPNELKDIIFERFRQGPSKPKHKQTGAGLGLTIARALCQRHRGDLWVEDTPGGGATFVATFAVKLAER